MAVMSEYKCLHCGETFYSNMKPLKVICNKCILHNVEIEDKHKHFSGLDALTVEQRLRKIEEWLYENALAKKRSRFDI